MRFMDRKKEMEGYCEVQESSSGKWQLCFVRVDSSLLQVFQLRKKKDRNLFSSLFGSDPPLSRRDASAMQVSFISYTYNFCIGSLSFYFTYRFLFITYPQV